MDLIAVGATNPFAGTGWIRFKDERKPGPSGLGRPERHGGGERQDRQALAKLHSQFLLPFRAVFGLAPMITRIGRSSPTWNPTIQGKDRPRRMSPPKLVGTVA